MLWNYICKAAFTAAATNLAVQFPTEVGIKVDSKYIPIWNISKEGFDALTICWNYNLRHFKPQEEYLQCENMLNHARLLADQNPYTEASNFGCVYQYLQ